MILTTYSKKASNLGHEKFVYPKPPAWFVGRPAEDFLIDEEYIYSLKKGQMTNDAFARLYIDTVLAKLDPQEMYEKYDGFTLVGMYKPHNGYLDVRFLISAWLRNTIKAEIKEIE